jgi:peroxiredoxin
MDGFDRHPSPRLESIMSLQTELDSFRANWEARVGQTIADHISNDIADLRGSGILDHAAKAGQMLPNVTTLLDEQSKPFALHKLVVDKAAIITFYRGGWCPYCNLELRAYQALLPEIRAAGAELVAISPELPDHSVLTAEENALEYTVLSDPGSTFAAALGIRFTLSETLRPFYEKAGHALPDRNGDGSWALPMPATFVVNRGGRIAQAFIEPDYRKRLDPQDAVNTLLNLVVPKAA